MTKAARTDIGLPGSIAIVAWAFFVSGCDQKPPHPKTSETKRPVVARSVTPTPQEVVASHPVSGKPIGTWQDSSPILGSRISIYEDGLSVYADQIFTDGSRRTLRLVESESSLGRRFDEAKEASDEPEELTPRQREMQATEAGREFARTKLAELDKFKSSAEFELYGFAIAGPFNSWLKAVDAKRDDKGASFYDKLTAGNLVSLGFEYMHTKGQETDFSRITRREIVETIDNGRIDTDPHDYWVIVGGGDLQIRDKDGLIATARKIEEDIRQ